METQLTNSNEKEKRQQSGGEERDTVEENDAILKRKIACHSLCELLVETHVECLKVCIGNISDVGRIRNIHQNNSDSQPCFCTFDQTELDQFMETYCTALRKLKDAIEEPQEESMAFINSMHSQLKDLMDLPSTSTSTTTSFSGGKNE